MPGKIDEQLKRENGNPHIAAARHGVSLQGQHKRDHLAQGCPQECACGRLRCGRVEQWSAKGFDAAPEGGQDAQLVIAAAAREVIQGLAQMSAGISELAEPSIRSGSRNSGHLRTGAARGWLGAASADGAVVPPMAR